MYSDGTSSKGKGKNGSKLKSKTKAAERWGMAWNPSMDTPF
ncbi:hypothetical protein EVA_08269 [gut metagenome]|uniref:Uncharacterized protein n=1 Tax=gut metagenome TaxID=749906 RepID=J9GTH4_9ZZZZ